MPAVNPSRLQPQIEEVLKYFDNPVIFHKRLSDLFSLYANRTLQFGQSSEPAPLIPSYHLPLPLIRQLQMAVRPYLERDPQTALKAADELWNDSFFEVKQFATSAWWYAGIKKETRLIWIQASPSEYAKVSIATVVEYNAFILQ